MGQKVIFFVTNLKNKFEVSWDILNQQKIADFPCLRQRSQESNSEAIREKQ
jgi:hypothetical protein